MPVQEYVDQPFNQKKEMFKLMAEICQKKCAGEYSGFSTVPISTSTGKKSFIFCNADHADRVRVRASTSL